MSKWLLVTWLNFESSRSFGFRFHYSEADKDLAQMKGKKELQLDSIFSPATQTHIGLLKWQVEYTSEITIAIMVRPESTLKF